MNDMAKLLNEVAQLLHLSEDAAAAASREGVVVLEGQPVECELSTDCSELVISSPLGKGLLSTNHARRQALACSLPLSIAAGIAIGDDLEEAMLIRRWRLEGGLASDLAQHIAELAVLGTAIRKYGLAPLHQAVSKLVSQP